jgi:hypothetical protein
VGGGANYPSKYGSWFIWLAVPPYHSCGDLITHTHNCSATARTRGNTNHIEHQIYVLLHTTQSLPYNANSARTHTHTHTHAQFICTATQPRSHVQVTVTSHPLATWNNLTIFASISTWVFTKNKFSSSLFLISAWTDGRTDVHSYIKWRFSGTQQNRKEETKYFCNYQSIRTK